METSLGGLQACGYQVSTTWWTRSWNLLLVSLCPKRTIDLREFSLQKEANQ